MSGDVVVRPARTRARPGAVRPGDTSPAPDRLGEPDGAGREHARRRRVVALLGALTLASCVLLMVVDVQVAWSFVLPLRGLKLAALVVVGVAVGTSTVLFQTVTANRILTPAIMGFDSLFVLVQTVAVATLGSFAVLTADPRLRFAVEVGVLLVFGLLLHALVLRRTTSGDVVLLVLVGVVLGTLFSSLTLMVSRVLDPNDALTLQDLLFASVGTVDAQLLPLTAVVVALCLLLVVRRLRVLDVVALGRETAIGLGVDHSRVVRRSLAVVAVLVAVSTALVGPLTFLGLLAANLAREALGTHLHRWTVPAACLVAVLALVGGQVLLEHVLGFGTALAVVIDVVGGLYLLLLLLRQGRATAKGLLP
ncbi:iron chelate uptake ABC transporter family permease subunit [uncultured Pseudokineococcus sp.]|uniref:iron chelate uptake ABC transporter family permease subunit n=1 Tax=uncultured Pseudokineococcus sp. TaxID=1642928 RepID=UPI0026049A35|nr:iron chelate uptake ABC transporter family permease subunit [uncultured Pseudokineococcus sp.]